MPDGQRHHVIIMPDQRLQLPIRLGPEVLHLPDDPRATDLDPNPILALPSLTQRRCQVLQHHRTGARRRLPPERRRRRVLTPVENLTLVDVHIPAVLQHLDQPAVMILLRNHQRLPVARHPPNLLHQHIIRPPANQGSRLVSRHKHIAHHHRRLMPSPVLHIPGAMHNHAMTVRIIPSRLVRPARAVHRNQVATAMTRRLPPDTLGLLLIRRNPRHPVSTLIVGQIPELTRADRHQFLLILDPSRPEKAPARLEKRRLRTPRIVLLELVPIATAFLLHRIPHPRHLVEVQLDLLVTPQRGHILDLLRQVVRLRPNPHTCRVQPRVVKLKPG